MTLSSYCIHHNNGNIRVISYVSFKINIFTTVAKILLHKSLRHFSRLSPHLISDLSSKINSHHRKPIIINVIVQSSQCDRQFVLVFCIDIAPRVALCLLQITYNISYDSQLLIG